MILGCDPGTNGAIALLDHHGHIVECHDMPTPNRGVTSAPLLAQLLNDALKYYDTPTQAIVEHINARPPTGASSACKLGKSAGIMLGILAAHHIPVTQPTPSQWKTKMGVGAKGIDPRVAAAERWPADADLFTRIKDRDRAEACLLAAWWLDHGRTAR